MTDMPYLIVSSPKATYPVLQRIRKWCIANISPAERGYGWGGYRWGGNGWHAHCRNIWLDDRTIGFAMRIDSHDHLTLFLLSGIVDKFEVVDSIEDL